MSSKPASNTPPVVSTKTYSTKGLANLFHVEANTIRRGLCCNGHYLGLKPIKLGNGRLVWPADLAHTRLRGEV